MAVAEITSLVLEKGTDFEATFKIFNDDNSIASLIDSTAVSKIRKYPTSPSAISFKGPPLTEGGDPVENPSINPFNSSITIYLPKEETLLLTSGRNYFDILLTKGPNTFKVLKGTIMVEESISS